MGWEETMRAAEAAKNRMLSNRLAGEKNFARLIAENQGDGMVHFQRGLAYESLDEKTLAIRDFQRAYALFPKTEWKQLAKQALQRLASEQRNKKPKTKKKSSRKTYGSLDKRRRVWIVHGRDERLRAGMFAFIRSIDLTPLEFSEARRHTRKSAPYVGEILDAAFEHAQAVIVLLTPDDQARLRSDLLLSSDEHFEKELTGQARPNVLFEAGMALVNHPKQTILVQIGYVRPFSDVAGRHIVHMDGSVSARQEVASRLEDAGCPVNWRGKDWHTAGDLTSRQFTETQITKTDNPQPSDIERLINEREDDHAINDRINESLNNPRFNWRSIKSVATAAAITEDRALTLLRANPLIKFGTNRKGETIVGLRSRV